MLAYESGEEFMAAYWSAARGELEPFVLVLEGSVPNEEISGEGHWSGLGIDPDTGQPIKTTTWIDRLAPRASAVLALGTCAAYGGVPAMRGNPTGAMGLRDYLGHDWTSRLGLPIVNLPGCPVQPDNITETLLHIVLAVAGVEGPLELDAQGRPRWLFERTVQEGCGRAGFAEQGEFARTSRRPPRVPGEARLQGAGGQVQRARARLGGRHRRLPQRGRDLHGVHDARFPRPLYALHGAGRARPARGPGSALQLRAGVQAHARALDPRAVRRRARVAQALVGARDRVSTALVSTRVVFRCEFCAAVPDERTQKALEHGLRELAFGEYVDVPPGRWLAWHGGGPLGPRRYACAQHRGELTAFLREHYGTIAPNPWKRPPYPTSVRTPDTERAISKGALSSIPKWGLW